MAYNVSHGGIRKPIRKDVGILFHAEAGAIDTSTIEADSDLVSLGFKDAGMISTDGVTISSNSDSAETYEDFNKNIVDSETSASSLEISFKLLQLFTKDTLSLVYADSAITAGADGAVSKIQGTANPTNKTLVLKTMVKGRPVVKVIHEASFSTRGDEVYAADELAGYEVTYTILTAENGLDVTELIGA